MKLKIKKLDIKRDSRGLLSELIRSEDIKKQQFGQIISVLSYPDQVRGSHYHKRKTEWYCVIKGKGRLTTIDNLTGKKEEVVMGENNFVAVEIPPNYSHSIKNIGKAEMILIVYVDEPFNPIDADTYPWEEDLGKENLRKK